MSKADNLYAEVVINESPYYYDENGRLRVHVLNEQSEVASEEQTLDEMSVRGPETTQGGIMLPGTPIEPGPVTSTVSNGAPPKPRIGSIFGRLKQKPKLGGLTPMPEKKPGEQTPPPGMELNPDYKDRFSGGRIGTMDRRPSDEKFRPKKPLAPVEKTDMPDMRIGLPRSGMRKPLPAIPPSGGATIGQGFEPGEEKGMMKPAVEPRRPAVGKPFRSFRFSSQSRAGSGKNMNTRVGLRSVRPAPRNMMETAKLATDYIEEKMNLKTAEMGEVIKDFQKSDAPQFKGKSKEKRRIMAIAAKLQAERGDQGTK